MKIKLLVKNVKHFILQTMLRFNGIFKTKRLQTDECVQVMFRVGYLVSYDKTSSKVKYSKWNTQKTYCITVKEGKEFF